MPRQPREKSKTGIYHIIARGINQQDIFHDEDDFDMPIHELWEQVINKLRGYYQHYGITDNSYMMANYFCEAKKILFKWLNRRSQRKSFNWNKFGLFLNKYPLPSPKVYVSIFEFRPGIALPL